MSVWLERISSISSGSVLDEGAVDAASVLRRKGVIQMSWTAAWASASAMIAG
jgi:hypothetical protein